MKKQITRLFILFIAINAINGEAVSKAVSLPKKHEINIEDFKFQPPNITVNRGDSIVWTNKDIVPHFINVAEAKWESQVMEEGQSWEIKFNQNSSYEYFCIFHPDMKGMVIVQD